MDLFRNIVFEPISLAVYKRCSHMSTYSLRHLTRGIRFRAYGSLAAGFLVNSCACWITKIQSTSADKKANEENCIKVIGGRGLVESSIHIHC